MDDDEEDGDDENEGEEEEEDHDDSVEAESRHSESTLKKFRQEDMSEEVKKGQAVKNQLGTVNNLFHCPFLYVIYASYYEKRLIM